MDIHLSSRFSHYQGSSLPNEVMSKVKALYNLCDHKWKKGYMKEGKKPNKNILYIPSKP